MVGKMKGVSDMKERLKVEELEENIEELKGVAQDVFPALVFTVIVSSVLLFIFLLRLYIRWGAECPSKNRMDGKTVIVTGQTCFLFLFFPVIFFAT